MKLDLNAMASKIDANREKKVEEKKIQKAHNSISEIAVIGMACRIASSNSLDEYWTGLESGVEYIRSFPLKRQKYGEQFLKLQDKYDGTQGYYDGGFLEDVDQFDNDFFGISPIEADLMSPEQRNFLQVAWSAIEDAGYGNEKLSKEKTGIFLGHSTDFGISYKEFIDILNPDMQTFAISGNLNSIISSRLAYILDLKGPSMNVDTACSSALVAIHTACRSLRNGECNVAIVGSSKIDNLPLKTIKQREDQLGITSTDGKTRTFDYHSNGTGLGEGVGAILLKPLHTAMRDRDNIYAVIKGSAVNQDGKSANLTSPNPLAQEEVILKAWQDARINPESISYIEAHGTATKLGDPIEIEGITRAFRNYTDKKQFCAIGSVKSNIGHLDNAAGIAGIIKVILSLKHKELPKSLYFTSANEKIRFEDTPLYVNSEHRKWEPNGEKRRCGISAFGLSGTNCHIILEEAEDRNETHSLMKSEFKIFTLSAKTKERLKEYIWKYQEFLYKNLDVSLEDMCYSANTGRKHYECRLAILFKTREELQGKLQQAFLYSLEELNENDMFYGEPGKTALTKEKANWNELLLEVSNKELQCDIEQLRKLCFSYVNTILIDWDLFYKHTAYRKISLPTYPFQRKSHWISVAEERINAKKVLSKEIRKMHPLVHECIADSFDTVIYKSVLNVEDYWVFHEHLVEQVPVIPGTTYIEMVYEVIRKHYNNDSVELRNLVFLNPLALDYGQYCELHTIIKEEDNKLTFMVTSKKEQDGRWNIHAKGRCILGLEKKEQIVDINEIKKRCIYDELKEYSYEKGKGITLSERWDCIRKIDANDKEILAYLTLRDEYVEEGKSYSLHPALLDEAVNVALRTVGEGLYLPFSYKNLKIFEKLPNELYSYIVQKDNDNVQKEMAEYDILLMDTLGCVCIKIEGYVIKRVDFSKIQNAQELEGITYYTKQWKISESEEVSEQYAHDITYVLYENNEKAIDILNELKHKEKNVVEIIAGSDCAKLEGEWIQLSSAKEGYEMLVDMTAAYKSCHIIDLCSLELCKETVVNQHKQLLEESIYKLIHFVKTMMKKNHKVNIQLTLLGQFAYEITGKEAALYPWIASYFGLGNALYLENSKIRCKSIDMDDETSVSTIVGEILRKSREYEVAFRSHKRYVEQIKEMQQIQSDVDFDKVKENGVYVITGGTGSLGLEVAKHFSFRANVTLALLNRSEFPAKEDWESMLKHSDNQKLREKIQILQEIEAHGSKVNIYSVDVTDEEALEQALNSIREICGKIYGLVHTAGVAGDGVLFQKEDTKLREVMEPKMIGTILLDKLTARDDLDFFIMFSSISAIVPEAGQLDYAAANCFLDSYAYYRNRKRGKTIAINWPAFLEKGMAVDYHVDFSKEVFKPIKTKEAMLVMDWVLSQKEKQVIIGKVDESKYQALKSQDVVRTPIKNVTYRIMHKVHGKEVNSNSIKMGVIELLGKNGGYTDTEKIIAQAVGNALGIKSVNILDNFQKVGGNSILAIKVQMELEDKGINLSLSDLLTYDSLEVLADHIDNGKRSRLGEVDSEGADIINAESKEKEIESKAIVIDRLEPFIDIIYKGCFYSAMIPIILHYKRGIEGLIFNDIISYQYKDENNFSTFGIRYDSIVDLDDYLSQEGISIEKKVKSECIIQDLEASINSGVPVIVSIDCWYESISIDCYQKEHWPHNILVYGYCSDEQIFYIIEHKGSMSTYYEKLTMSYDELIRCYNGFQENFEHLDIIDSNLYDLSYDEQNIAPGAYVVKLVEKKEKDSQNEYISRYFEKYLVKEDMILKGFDFLKDFQKKFIEILKDESLLVDKVDELIEILNKVLSGKNVEKYRYQKLKDSAPIQSEIQSIIANLEVIRNILVKYSFSKVYLPKLAQKSEKCMSEIIEHEVKLYELLKEMKYEGEITKR